MKTPLWDIDPSPTVLFDPNIERATRLSVRLVEGGVPVEIAAGAEAMPSRWLIAMASIHRLPRHPCYPIFWPGLPRPRF